MEDEKAEILGLGIIYHILLGAVFVNVGIINNDSFGAGLSICGVIFIIAALAVVLIKIRCPFCRHFLGVLCSSKKMFCPYCGCKIDDE